MIKEVKIIRGLTTKTEQLIQLAEEANELAIASLAMNEMYQLRSVCKSQYHELEIEFIEEIADVKITIDIIGDYIDIVDSIGKLSKHTIPKRLMFKKLAKSCCELSKSAIKYRRTLVPNASPTPITEDRAEVDFITKILTVKSYIDSIGNYWNCDDVKHIQKEKAIRCINRYTNK